MIEVEIKLPVGEPEELKRRLPELGFREGKRVREEDLYFNSDFHDFRKSDEALRIRRVQNLNTGESHAFLTYKGPKLDQISMTRKELETGIEDMDVMREVLRALGYVKQYPVNKVRRYFEKENVTACLDEVEGLGFFMELEVLVSEEKDREEALSTLKETSRLLGHSMDETTRTSYLTMLMRKDGVPGAECEE
ncbi:MAG: class IV adenylate cyclase [Clostridiales bacterium]|nr:class IV adenylate cyclase [Candidatus Blautia equi]